MHGYHAAPRKVKYRKKKHTKRDSSTPRSRSCHSLPCFCPLDFDAGSHLSQAGLELPILLPPPPSKCWDYKRAPPHPSPAHFLHLWAAAWYLSVFPSGKHQPLPALHGLPGGNSDQFGSSHWASTVHTAATSGTRPLPWREKGLCILDFLEVYYITQELGPHFPEIFWLCCHSKGPVMSRAWGRGRGGGKVFSADFWC